MQNQTLKPITVTVDNALRLSGLGRTKFYELINQGKIKTTTIGRRRLVAYSSLEELANE
ncbi:MAG: helix-turn-helix domain-containing protein [Rickettsiales bacterium]